MSTQIDYEVDDNIKMLCEKIMRVKQDLHWIMEYQLLDKIGYVRAYVDKRSTGSTVFADCRIVPGPYRAFIPYEILITVYHPTASMLNDNQFKLLLYHELKHINYGNNGVVLRKHDVQDFYIILNQYGIDWASFGNEKVPDILEEKGEYTHDCEEEENSSKEVEEAKQGEKLSETDK